MTESVSDSRLNKFEAIGVSGLFVFYIYPTIYKLLVGAVIPISRHHAMGDLILGV